jgi:hypothetical protein
MEYQNIKTLSLININEMKRVHFVVEYNKIGNSSEHKYE